MTFLYPCDFCKMISFTFSHISVSTSKVTIPIQIFLNGSPISLYPTRCKELVTQSARSALFVDVCPWEYYTSQLKFPWYFEPNLYLFFDSPYLDIMPTPRSSAAESANSRRKGKSSTNKSSSARDKASTFNGEFSAEQMALYNAMHSQLAAKKKAVTAADNEGM